MERVSLLRQLTTDLAHFIGEADDDGIQQLVVGAVVGHDGQVLLLQRPGDDFMGGILELPSGKVEANETLDAALVREVKEETGLDVSALRVYLGSFDYLSGSGRKSRQFNFAVDVTTCGPIELREHDAYHWAALTEQPPVTDAVRNILDTYRELLSA